MRYNFDRGIAHVLVWEGGAAIRDNEPGGGVNRGISLHAYREEHPGASMDDLMKMPEEEAKRIYRKNYADKIGFDTLAPGLDVAMLHGAVMLGVNGVKRLQEKSGSDWAHLIVLMMQNKMHRKDGLRYMPGWSDRFVSVYGIAKELSVGVQSDLAG